MKESLEPGFQPNLTGRPGSHRDWNSRSVFRVVRAVALLVGVCLLASRIPDAPPEANLALLGGFMFYWVAGGLVTVALLIISDRATRGS